MLFTARHRPGQLVSPLLEPRKNAIHALDIGADRILAIAPGKGAHLQVLVHRQLGEDPPPFGH
ncbi:hypothetical protein D3C79_1078050 [compost metagenome]